MIFRRGHIILLAILLIGCSRELPQRDVVITPCAMPPEGRVGVAYTAIDSTVYVLCGRSESHAVTSSALVYDASADQWTEAQTPIPARVHATAITLNGDLYVGLGYGGAGIYKDESFLRDFYRYEPATNSWIRLADYPSENTVAPISFTDGQYIYVGFGYRHFTHELFRYDTEKDEWTQVSKGLSSSDFPPRVMSPIAGNVANRCFVGSGHRNNVGSFFAEYIPADDRWEKRTAVPGKARHNAACTTTDEMLFVFGGWHYGDSLTTGFHFDDILAYKPEEDKWLSYGTMPDGKAESRVAARIGNTVYFGLGEDQHGKILKHFYRFEVK